MTQVEEPHSLQGSEKFEAYPIHLSQQSLVDGHGNPVNQTTGHKLYSAQDSRHRHHGSLCCSVHRQPMSGVNSWTHQVGLSRTRPDKIVLIIQVFQSCTLRGSWLTLKNLTFSRKILSSASFALSEPSLPKGSAQISRLTRFVLAANRCNHKA